jgi:hemoglobin
MKKDIETIEDIRQMVDLFYSNIRQNKLLKNIFEDVIQDKWDIHLEKMYRFWQTVLLDQHTYHGSPFVPHAKLPVDTIHFQIWINIFNETVDSLFVGEKAERAKWQGARMAEMFESKIKYYRNNNQIPIL